MDISVEREIITGWLLLFAYFGLLAWAAYRSVQRPVDKSSNPIDKK